VSSANLATVFLHSVSIQLAMMDGDKLPLALGVIRDYSAPTYEEEVAKQVEEVRSRKNFKNLRDMILSTMETWEVK